MEIRERERIYAADNETSARGIMKIGVHITVTYVIERAMNSY